jgi:O-antigen/teichoic acid export membrane protein
MWSIIKWRLFKDFGTSIIGSLVAVVSLQLLVYPYLARINSPEAYGIILTIMGIVNIIIVGLGTSLNNIRLVQNVEYMKHEIQGDFNVILIGILLIGSLILFIINQYFLPIDNITSALLIFTLMIGLCRAYFCVSYRLKLNFTLNMVCNCIIASGYVIGLIAAFFTSYWPLAFLLGEISGCIFIFFTTDILRESIKTTALFKQTLMKYLALIITGLIGNLIIYMDRLILYPTLGGEAVSTYTVASFFGKSLGLVLVPIAGVLLGYYAQKNFNMTRSLFWKINLAVAVFSLLFYFLSYFLANWFTGLLYPTLIESASPYIMLANIAAIIGAASSMTQPAVMRYSPMRWQIIIQLIYGVIYLVGGLVLLKYYFITGFCVAAIIASVTRLLALYWIGNRSTSYYEMRAPNAN